MFCRIGLILFGIFEISKANVVKIAHLQPNG
jgi:hypothetical protein